MGKDVDGCCEACRQFGDQSVVPLPPPAPELRANHERVRILIMEKGGEPREYAPTKPEVRVGRVRGNDVVLPKGNVSKITAAFLFKDDKVIVVDLKSGCGTYVDGRKISAPTVINENSKIYIGDFILQVVPIAD